MHTQSSPFPPPGTDLGACEVAVSEAANDRYWRGAAIDHSLRAAGFLYPPMAVNFTMLLVQQCIPGGLLHTWGRLRCHTAAKAGQRLQTTGSVVERFEKRGRDYCVVATEIRSANGDLLWTAETELASSLHRETAGDTEAPGRPRYEIPPGAVVTSRPLTLTADLLRTYSRAGNFHSDDEAAREMGLPGMVAMGMQTIAPAWAVVLDDVGDDLLSRGELETRFFGLVLEDESIDASVARDHDEWTFSVRNETKGIPTAGGVIRLA